MEEKRSGSGREASSPDAPPFLGLTSTRNRRALPHGCCATLNSSTEMWNNLFENGYRADVLIRTNDGIIPAHASVLGMASPVIRDMLKKSKRTGSRRKSISIRGVPHDCVRVFLRFLYSSCYQQEEMTQYVMHLLVLSHVFVIPPLKRVCVHQLESGLLTTENVIDVFQLAWLCDAPRLCLLCHRMMIKSFRVVFASEGWKVMRQTNPKLEKELVESVIDADLRKKERLKKVEERKIYLQLHEAMEALVHICRDGCRTIGPHDKVFKGDKSPCNFPACKGLESLIRHFAMCKNRVHGSCTHCKRMWQLLELHSRLCSQAEGCRVPLCRHFKEKTSSQSKKDEVKWRLLVNKVQEAKSFSGAAFVSFMVAVSA